MTHAALNPRAHWADPALLRRHWLTFAGIVLVGYAVDGRGFAYIGFPPIFVGEIMLLTGAALLLFGRRWTDLFSSIPLLFYLALAAWCLLRTLPYISTYKFDAVRDAALWAYGILAVIVASMLISEPTLLQEIVKRYKTGVYVILILCPIFTLIHRLFYFARPAWPWAPDIEIIQQKEGDVLVHMSAILGFWICGFVKKVPWIWIALLTFSVAWQGSTHRAGLICFFAVLAIAWFFRPHSRIPFRIFFLVAIALFLLWITAFRYQVPGGKQREISFDQIVTNVVSVVYDTGERHMDGTKEWRMDWWKDIIRYTFNGPYFWKGKGFGVNLADDDGFQVLNESKLRTPHCIHMTILARAGVPGFCLWALTLITWGAACSHHFFLARKKRQTHWANLFLFIGCFWLSCLINASFDVYFEGPMGGIWFWCIFGFGIGAMWIHTHHPHLLRPLEQPE